MIVLDTSVISELMRPTPGGQVAAWLAQQRGIPLAITTVTVAEIVHGLARLPPGRRRDALVRSFEAMVAPANRLSILPLDEDAARRAGAFGALRQSLGRPVDAIDMMIAGIADANGASLATRNIRDFEGIGLTLIEPA